jgi:hypothetical protein
MSTVTAIKVSSQSSLALTEVEVTLWLPVGQSVSMSRYRAHSGTCDQILLSVRSLLSERFYLVSVGCPLWREVGSVICHSQSVVTYQYLHQRFTFHAFYSWEIYMQYVQSSFHSRFGTADYALLVTISWNYHSSVITLTLCGWCSERWGCCVCPETVPKTDSRGGRWIPLLEAVLEDLAHL